MELMDRSLHDLYKLVYEKLHLIIPEWVVGKMADAVSSHRHSPSHTYTYTFSFFLTHTHILYLSLSLSQTVKALHYLKANLNVLHRGTKFYTKILRNACKIYAGCQCNFM